MTFLKMESTHVLDPSNTRLEGTGRVRSSMFMRTLKSGLVDVPDSS